MIDDKTRKFVQACVHMATVDTFATAKANPFAGRGRQPVKTAEKALFKSAITLLRKDSRRIVLDDEVIALLNSVGFEWKNLGSLKKRKRE